VDETKVLTVLNVCHGSLSGSVSISQFSNLISCLFFFYHLKILGVEKIASQQEIKKVYHKLALRLHPDKNPRDEEAKEKFQQLQKVISILGDA